MKYYKETLEAIATHDPMGFVKRFGKAEYDLEVEQIAKEVENLDTLQLAKHVKNIFDCYFYTNCVNMKDCIAIAIDIHLRVASEFPLL